MLVAAGSHPMSPQCGPRVEQSVRHVCMDIDALQNVYMNMCFDDIFF